MQGSSIRVSPHYLWNNTNRNLQRPNMTSSSTTPETSPLSNHESYRRISHEISAFKKNLKNNQIQSQTQLNHSNSCCPLKEKGLIPFLPSFSSLCMPQLSYPTFSFALSRCLTSSSLSHLNLTGVTESTDAAACIFSCFSSPQRLTTNSSPRWLMHGWELEEGQRGECFTLFGADETLHLLTMDSQTLPGFTQCLGTKHAVLQRLLFQQRDLAAWKQKHL